MIRTVIILLTCTILLFGADVFGVITKTKGISQVDGKSVSVADKVYVGQTILTNKNSRILIKQKNGNIIAIGKNSTLKLDDKFLVTQEKGNIFFNIAKKAAKFGKYRFKIKLKTATMGIRGTNFIVKNGDENEEILLREGKLEFMAKNNAFALYKKKIEDEFNTFKNEFKEYENELIREFNQYKKEENYQFDKFATKFDLEENSLVVLSGQKAYKAKLDKKIIKAKFQEFDEFVK